MKVKRILSAALAFLLVFSAIPFVKGASSFLDITDETVAADAEVLRLMGVAEGVGDGVFDPEGVLTRAQFCTMAIRLMGKENEVRNHLSRTIFSDVTAKHWARGYINLAAVTPAGNSGSMLIAGVGNGSFMPDAPITYAQAVTVLMRILGYGDETVGAVWPTGYLNRAHTVGLLEGTDSQPNSAITRALAARLFVNMLSCKTLSGGKFYASLGNAEENVLLLEVNVQGDNGEKGAILTSKGTYFPASGFSSPIALRGSKGVMILNDKNEMAAFIPDGSRGTEIVLSEPAEAAYIKDQNGKRYTVGKDVPVYTDDAAVTYQTAWLDMAANDRVTLFISGGKVQSIYHAGKESSAQALVSDGSLTKSDILGITNGSQNFKIVKYGKEITAEQTEKYDVLTYSERENTVYVSSYRLPCVFERAYPSPSAPQTVTVLGNSFSVLQSAADSIKNFKPGDSVVLLLTCDGKIAAMEKPLMQPAGTVFGMATAEGVKVYFSGQEILLKGQTEHLGKIVTVSGAKDQQLIATPVINGISGSVDTENMTAAGLSFAADALIFEQHGGEQPVCVSLAELKKAQNVTLKAAAKNPAGEICMAVISGITGDAYSYGILKSGKDVYYDSGLSIENTTVYAESDSGQSTPLIWGKPFDAGVFGGVIASNEKIGNTFIADGVIYLTCAGSATRSDFFEKDGRYYVRTQSGEYPIADSLQGYIKELECWFSPSEDLLYDIRAYGGDLVIYADPISMTVRIISAE